ncbi:alanine-glyoxylate transaminase / serine-glyoxylate transaminase / serine-pyruvate transaminase [Nitratireductor aquibiodomus]|uniref:Serine--glyoxylate aminotransferase n=1 Tax=Nitratireductor aquibiodomus TaxID=204799 RepID=A0A1H4KFL3_9HYPH|nr:aminotransferase class V-fold PLP-dependent enzyme [Nitratireductor aquibiodomus]SEB57173.1 alanine-glyoxylate transaminase / serine-glyoxylate transaminase / serine-pyruvate transaminase [Nitratireductor aquibiodomus]
MPYRVGQHFLHIPGPSPVPDRVRAAIGRQIIDHRSPEFAALGHEVLSGIREIFNTQHPVLIFPSSGTGAWESAIVNTLNVGDRVLMVETGHFADLWRRLAENWGVEVDMIPGDWRDWADPEVIRARLAADHEHKIKAVMVVHNETSTGVVSPIAQIRHAIDDAGHPALLMVDAISSLGSLPFLHDAWGIDVTVSCSQKGLMLPPGLGLVALSPRAVEVARSGGSHRSYWDWSAMLAANADGVFPYTPATNLLFGLSEVLSLLKEEGIQQVFARHDRLAAATRAAVDAWGLETQCLNEAAHSSVLTGVVMPEGVDADAVRELIRARYNLSLGQGLSRLKGRIFRIGHLGQCNELTLMAALSGVEMGFADSQVPFTPGGVQAAMEVLRN